MAFRIGRPIIAAMSDPILHLSLLEDEEILLDEAALELAALDHPGLDLAPYLDTLEAIAREVAAADVSPLPQARAATLARIMAGDHGFSGDSLTYEDPANADLIRVIDRRRGLPVSLSILYVAAARSAGWQADALNTPGHVLMRIGDEADHFLIDPFAGGAPVGPRQLATGAGAPMSNRSVLVSLLMNQATRAEQGGDPARALTLFGRITTVAPAYHHGWWEKARLERASGMTMAARASLGAMLEMTREPVLRDRIVAALAALSRTSG